MLQRFEELINLENMSDNEGHSTLNETSTSMTKTKEAVEINNEIVEDSNENGPKKEVMHKYVLQNDSFSIIESKNKNEEVSSDDGELPDSDGEIENEPSVAKQPSADNFNLGENHGDELDYDEFDLHNNENKNSISKELEDGEISDGEIVSGDEGDDVKKTPVKVKPSVEKEEGEMSSDGEDVGIPSDEVCKFYKRGSCRWGAMCKFRHSEDPNTSGNYSMFESFQTPVKPSPRKPQEKSNAVTAASKPPKEETAWEKGLREMKEMRLRSKQRKAYDPEFHRKREVVNLNQDINKDDEIDGAGGRNFQEFNTKGYDPLAELEDDERYSAPTIQEINRMRAIKMQQRGRQMGPSPMNNYNQGRHSGYGGGYSAPPAGRYPYDGSRLQHDGRYPPSREQQMRRSPYRSLERRNDSRGADRDFRNDRDFRSDQHRNNGNNWNGRPNNDGPTVDKFGRNIDRRQRPDSESSQSGSRYVTMEKRGDQWNDPWIRQTNNRKRSRDSSSSGSSSGYSRHSSRSSSGSSSRSSSSSSSASSRSSSSSRSPSPATRKTVKVKQEKKVEVKNEKPAVKKFAQPRKVTVVGMKRARESSSDEFSNSDSEAQPALKKKKSPLTKKARKESSSSGSSSGSESSSSGSSSSGSSSDSDSSSGSSSDSDGENKASKKRYGNIDHDSRRKAAKLDPAHQKMIHEKQKQIQEQLRSVETAIRKKRAKLN